MSTDYRAVEDAHCSCRMACGHEVGDDLLRLEDLLLHGFDQPTASLMLWVWDRGEVAARLGAAGGGKDDRR